MRIPLCSVEDGKLPAWWEWLFAPVFIVVITIVGGSFLLIVLFVVPFLWVGDRLKAFRFARTMQKSGRFIKWRMLKPKLLAAEDTLIIESGIWGGYCLRRTWWTPDDVLAVAPAAPPDDLDIHSLDEPHPFHVWSYERYAEPKTGTATLTTRPLRAAFVPHFYRRNFPALTVVYTVYGGPLKRAVAP